MINPENTRKAITLLERALLLDAEPDGEDKRIATDDQWSRVVEAVQDAGAELIGVEQQKISRGLELVRRIRDNAAGGAHGFHVEDADAAIRALGGEP